MSFVFITNGVFFFWTTSKTRI